MTLPGEGRDRVFKVTIKWVAQVSLYALEEALEGRCTQIPFEAIQALDVVMRHLPSMVYVSFVALYETLWTGKSKAATVLPKTLYTLSGDLQFSYFQVHPSGAIILFTP